MYSEDTINYFKLFGIPESYSLDVSELDKSYLELQRKFHPDRFVGKPENERIEAAQKSADVNEGYRVLKDSLLRAQYLLKLNGIVVGREAEDNVKPSPKLLEEMMELGELVSSFPRMRESSVEIPAFAGMTAGVFLKKEMDKCMRDISLCFESGDIKGAAEGYIRAKFLWRLMDNAKNGVKNVA